jgi:nucleoid-associated protein YgaU
MATEEGKKDEEKQPADYMKYVRGVEPTAEPEEKKPEYEPLVDFKVKTTHTVKGGENLSMISEKHYKTQANWIYIYRANMDVIGDNPNVIQPGMELKIPAL